MAKEHAGAETWRPTLLRLGEASGRAKLEELLEAGAIGSVHDDIESQLEDLAQVRNPSVKGPALAPYMAELAGDGPREEYGVWVHYPWSGRLVHVLPRDAFLELRSDRNRNKITRAEQKRLAELRVGVVGLSVGQATALTLAMEGVGGTFRLADFDELSLSNLNRLRAGVHEIGTAKAFITAREIFEMNPFVDISIFPEGITPENIEAFLGDGGPLDLVAEECDDLQVKILLREHARARKIPVIMETSDRGMVDIERFDLEPDRPLFHGLADDVRAADLRGLTAKQKVPTILRIIGASTISSRSAASMLDVGTALCSWPQLASSVALGGAVVTDVARRIALGQLQCSGRYYVDLSEIISDDTPSRHAYTEPYVIEHAEVEPTRAPALHRVTGDSVTPQHIEALVAHGVLAPSGGNCQPWRFVYEGGQLQCIHDEQRSASLLDFENVGSYLAIGAAVENIELAAAAIGLRSEAEVFPSEGQPSHVCRLRFSVDPSVEVPALARHITARVTNRNRGPRTPLPSGMGEALAAEAEKRGARLQLIEDDARLAAIGEVLGRGERQRLLSERMHREMMAEIRWTAEETIRTRDGLDIETLEMTPADLAGMRLVSDWSVMGTVKALDVGTGLVALSRDAIAASSAVGLVTVGGTSPKHYFEAGRAVQRVWLRATALGLAFQPMTALLYVFARLLRGGGEGLSAPEQDELHRLRTAYTEVFDVRDDHADAMIFRLAQAGPPTARSLRRDLGDVLKIQE